MYEPNFRPAVAVATRRQVRPFWRRQFSVTATPAQRRFDLAFGFVMPVLCLVFDPIVFHEWLSHERGLLGEWRLYAYTISTLEMVALAAWLLGAGGGRGRPPAALGGVLLAGGVFSLVVGVLILPFSILGLLFFVGAFGVTPFPTAFVYLRNGWRAAAPCRSGDDMSWGDAAALAFGIFFALVMPALTQLTALSD